MINYYSVLCQISQQQPWRAFGGRKSKLSWRWFFVALHILLRTHSYPFVKVCWCCPLAFLLLLLVTESLCDKQCLPGILHNSDLVLSLPQGEHRIQPSPGASVGRIHWNLWTKRKQVKRERALLRQELFNAPCNLAELKSFRKPGCWCLGQATLLWGGGYYREG